MKNSISEAAHELFITTLAKWMGALKEEYSCCQSHTRLAQARFMEMLLLGEIARESVKAAITNDEAFQKTMSDYITSMEKDIAEFALPPDEVFKFGTFVQRAATA